MAAFILRRLGQAILVMLTVGLIAFALFRFVGDPVVFMLGQDATPEDRARVTQQLGLDRPFYVQYAAFVQNALHGEFGLSLRQVRPVSTLIVERLPATLELSFTAALFALLAGIPMGVYTALRRDSWLSHLLLAVSLIGVSLPTFLIGILLILVFAVITETVFQWPGMGLLFIQAVTFADVPVMAAYLCLIGLFFVIINLVVDLLYYAVDPRLRAQPV